MDRTHDRYLGQEAKNNRYLQDSKYLANPGDIGQCRSVWTFLKIAAATAIKDGFNEVLLT